MEHCDASRSYVMFEREAREYNLHHTLISHHLNYSNVNLNDKAHECHENLTRASRSNTGTGFVSAGADKTVHFYEFDVTTTSIHSRGTFVRTRTLKMSDEVLSVRYSHTAGRSYFSSSTFGLDRENLLRRYVKVSSLCTDINCRTLSNISSDDTLLVSASSVGRKALGTGLWRLSQEYIRTR